MGHGVTTTTIYKYGVRVTLETVGRGVTTTTIYKYGVRVMLERQWGTG